MVRGVISLPHDSEIPISIPEISPERKVLTHANASVHSAAHIESSAPVSAPPPLQIAHADQLYHLQPFPVHYFPGICNRKPVYYTGPSSPHAASPLPTTDAPQHHLRARMLDAPVLDISYGASK